MVGEEIKISQGERILEVIENLLKTEAETAGTEKRILMQVEAMLETIVDLMQTVQPGEGQLLIQEENGEDYQEVMLRHLEHQAQNTFDNFNKISDSLAKVIKSLSDLIGESVDAIGQCKTARVKMMESLKNVMQKGK